MKKALRRITNYIIHGIPETKIEVVQKTPSQVFVDKKILITGGGRGLGFYIAKKCVSEGAKVIITGRKEEELKLAVNELGENARYLVFDISDIDNIEENLKKCVDIYNGIDCVVNNAGISLHESEITNVTSEDFDKQFNINLKGSYFLSQAYIKYYEKNNLTKGNIIFISSERGNQCDQIPYGLTKVAINSLTEGLARKYYLKGLRVNGVAPGVTVTDMTNLKRDDNMYCSYNSSKRYFVPEEVAEVVAFLISDVSSCITGEIIHTNAGNHLNPWWK